MFAAVVFALATSAAIAAPIAERGVPAGWATGYLENYDAYHTRYLALDCQDKHNTSFFDDCCHPLLATESLSDRPSYCRPNATDFASASALAATATVSAGADAASAYVSAAAQDTAAASSAVADAQVQVAQASTSTEAPTSTSTYEAPAQTTEASSGSSGQVMTGGYATYFYQGGNAGACGIVHSDSDKIIAIDSNGWWQNYNSGGPSDLCGKWINIVNTNNGKSVTAQVADVCPTCVSDNSLDLSVGAFTAIASEADGQVPITWTWA